MLKSQLLLGILHIEVILYVPIMPHRTVFGCAIVAVPANVRLKSEVDEGFE